MGSCCLEVVQKLFMGRKDGYYIASQKKFRKREKHCVANINICLEWKETIQRYCYGAPDWKIYSDLLFFMITAAQL